MIWKSLEFLLLLDFPVALHPLGVWVFLWLRYISRRLILVPYLIKSLIPYKVGLDLIFLMLVDWKFLELWCRELKAFGLGSSLFLSRSWKKLLVSVRDSYPMVSNLELLENLMP